MIDLGVVMGMLGFLSGVVAIIYSRVQASAERIQAQEAARMSTLQSNSELLKRSRDSRHQLMSIPAIRDEFLRTTALRPPFSELADLWKSDGGIERYLLYRDALDTGQDAYFLRRKAIMSDEHWYVWVKGHMSIWAQFSGFQRIFHVASQAGLLHPDFIKFYEPIFQGGEIADPAAHLRG